MNAAAVLVLIFWSTNLQVISQPMQSKEGCKIALERASKSYGFQDGFCVLDYSNEGYPMIAERKGKKKW